MLMAALVFVNFTLNNPQFSFSWSNTITHGIYIIYAVAMVFFILMGLINKNGNKEIRLLFHELKNMRNISIIIILLLILTIPLYSHVHHGLLYYIIVILGFVPFTFYRIVRNDSFEKKFYYNWEKRRKKGRLINMFREGLRTVFTIVVIVFGSQFIVNDRTPSFILSKLPINIIIGLMVFVLLLGVLGGIAAWHENERRYEKIYSIYK
jgi:amino acid transporter